MTSDSLTWRFGLSDYHLWHQPGVFKEQLSFNVAKNTRVKPGVFLSQPNDKTTKQEILLIAQCNCELLQQKPAENKLCGGKKRRPLSQTYIAITVILSFKVHIYWEEEHRITEGNTFHKSRKSLFFLETQGKPFFVPVGMRALCICFGCFCFSLQHYKQLAVLNLQAVGKERMFAETNSWCMRGVSLSVNQPHSKYAFATEVLNLVATLEHPKNKESKTVDYMMILEWVYQNSLSVVFLTRRKNQNVESEGSNALVYSE